jgi:cytochrome c oxidase subunit 2
VYVVAKQWMWKVQHPGGRREINTLHVPRGRAVKLTLTSQDVIHSFYVPAFRVKMDVLPDRYTTAWFQATKTGTFHLFCAEYCGTEHSLMRGRVVVMEPAAYQAWLGPGAQQEPIPGMPGTAEAPLRVHGRGAFFQAGCNACHVPDSDLRAPRLEWLFGSEVQLRNGQTVRADEEYLRESILEPNAKAVAGYPTPSLMPTYRGQVSEEQVVELIEYIKSLAPGRTVAPQEPP